jgi:hypothetical protein
MPDDPTGDERQPAEDQAVHPLQPFPLAETGQAESNVPNAHRHGEPAEHFTQGNGTATTHRVHHVRAATLRQIVTFAAARISREPRIDSD